VEGNLQEKLANILTTVAGPERFRAEVNADVDFTAVEETEESYDPEERVVRSEQSLEESRRGGDMAAAQRQRGYLQASALTDTAVQDALAEVSKPVRRKISILIDQAKDKWQESPQHADQSVRALHTQVEPLLAVIDALFEEYLVPLAEKTETTLDDQLLHVVRKLLRFVIWALGVIIGLNNAGYNVGALLAGLGIGGLALAMAAKDTVSNIFGGFTIFTDKPFQIGDRIRIDGFDGTVEEIGMRSTRLRTLAGTLVTIPNSRFSDSSVECVSAEPSRKVVATLGLTYDMSPGQMQQAMDTLGEIIATVLTLT